MLSAEDWESILRQDGVIRKGVTKKALEGTRRNIATNAKSMLRERGSAIRCVFWFFFRWLALGQHSKTDSDLDEA
jgi:hypothetical protein